jgi:tRNA modification GTPase
VYSPDDTIVAIATPPGRGGIGIVRVSGPEAHSVALTLAGRKTPLRPRHATLARISGTQAADQVVLTYFVAPHSYTGEDVVEISAHGSPVLLRAIVSAAVATGARLAQPGEFTFRAYLRGRIDLVQAEAVRDIVDAVTPLQARTAFDQLEGTLTGRIREVDEQLFDLAARLEASLDFPEEGYHFVSTTETSQRLDELVRSIAALLATSARGRLIREGLHVAIAGRPNVGKSSLFNQLAGVGRAIVTDIPGTTRDLLAETIDMDGVPMTIVDTAGVHTEPVDVVEAEGISRAVSARETAAVILLVLDRSLPLTDDDRRLIDATASASRVVVANQADLTPAWLPDEISQPAHAVSARTGEGIDALRAALVDATLGGEPLRDAPSISNLRHAALLAEAMSALESARDAAAGGTPEEFVLSDIHAARQSIEEVTGARTPDDVLQAIFERFCIGK